MKTPSEKLPNGLAQVLTRISSRDANERELAADQLTDFTKRLGSIAPAVAGLIVIAYVGETEQAAAEAQLHVLAEICVAYPIPRSVIVPVFSMDPRALWESEYHDNIREHTKPSSSRISSPETEGG